MAGIVFLGTVPGHAAKCGRHFLVGEGLFVAKCPLNNNNNNRKEMNYFRNLSNNDSTVCSRKAAHQYSNNVRSNFNNKTNNTSSKNRINMYLYSKNVRSNLNNKINTDNNCNNNANNLVSKKNQQ